MPVTIDELKNRIIPIAEQYGVGSVSLFGSYSKGTADKNSDVDLLIDKGSLRTLFQLSAFRLALEDAIGLPVDLVTKTSNDCSFSNSISKDEVLLYCAA